MKKIFCLVLMIVLVAGRFTGCTDFEAVLKNEDFDCSGFITGKLSEKYGGTFEIIEHEGSLTAFKSVDFVRCVENGIEFETHIEKNDSVWEMVSDSYLFMLYMTNFQQDTENYLNEYLTDYKIVPYNSKQSHTLADFSLPVPSDYIEYKKIYEPNLYCEVYIPNSKNFTDEELRALREHFGSERELYEPINLYILFNFYTVPDELLEQYDFYLPEYDSELYDYRNREKLMD